MSRIEVDAAVGSKDLVADLQRELPDTEVLCCHLDHGDIRFTGRGKGGTPVSVGVEFKVLQELVASIRTERVQGYQLPHMLKTYDYSWLLVEGLPTAGAGGYLTAGFGRPMGGRMTEDEFFKRELSWTVPSDRKFRHPYVHYTRTRAESVRYIRILYRWWTDVDLDAHKSQVSYYDPPQFLDVSLFRQMAMKLPGIGLELATRIEEHFAGNLLAALCAHEDEWAKVAGVGPIRAEALVRHCRQLRGKP